MTDIAIKDVPAALVDIHSKLVEKMGGQPTIPPSMRVSQAGVWSITLYQVGTYDDPQKISADSPAAAIKEALDYIENMIGKDEQRVVNWQKDLASVIDEGHDLNLPNTVMDPLRASSQAMTENLLTAAK
jgi:hypothetical protein